MIKKVLKFLFCTLLLQCLLLFACQQRDKSVVSSKVYDVGSIDKLPKKKSELNGWQNIRVKKCGGKCCEPVFPENFGYGDKKQLLALRNLVNSNLEDDVDCMMQVNESALKQLRLLATDKQDADAALMLVTPAAFGGFNLDGELAEEYAGEYQLPVLEKYQKLDSLLTQKKADEISTDLCSWLEVLGETSDRDRVKKLIPYLKSKNLNELSGMIAEKCGNVLK